MQDGYEEIANYSASQRLTKISSRLLFPFPSHFLSTIPIPVRVPMNSVYAFHSHGIPMGPMGPIGIPVSCTPPATSGHSRWRNNMSTWYIHLGLATTNQHEIRQTNVHTLCPEKTPEIFTALHAMQTRSSDENSVRPSVCPCVCPSHACIVTKR